METAIALVDFHSINGDHARPREALRLHDRFSDRSPARQDQYSLSHAPFSDATIPETVEVSTGKLQGGKALLLGLQLSGVMLINSVASGVITIGISDMAKDLKLDQSLVYWPVLAYNLTSSPLLLLFGAFADVLGARPISLLGCLGCGIFLLATGLARNGAELIAFRCLHGVAGALFLPTTLGIVSAAIASGRMRNVAIASLTFGQCVGYATGLVAGGVFTGTSIGWRLAWYLCGGGQVALFLLGLKAIPSNAELTVQSKLKVKMQKLAREVDWVGSGISCAAIAMLSYVLAMIAEDSSSIKEPLNATLLALSLAAIPGFAFWVRHQERRTKPALIPSNLWKTTFTSICVMITFSYAEMQSVELLASLFFQNIQSLSSLSSSLRLLPGLVVAASIDLSIGYIIHKLSIAWTLCGLSVVASISPLLMALINPAWPYWYEAFPAQVLYPVAVEVICMTSALIITESFPEQEQALAGAVFNTIANLGQAIGLALVAVITSVVSQGHGPERSSASLLEGYRAGYWASFAWMIITAGVAAFGLRRVGKVGVKRD